MGEKYESSYVLARAKCTHLTCKMRVLRIFRVVVSSCALFLSALSNYATRNSFSFYQRFNLGPIDSACRLIIIVTRVSVRVPRLWSVFVHWGASELLVLDSVYFMCVITFVLLAIHGC